MSDTPETTVTTPAGLTLDAIMAELVGFGVEEIAEPVRIVSKGTVLEIRFTNVAVDEEKLAHIATDEYKGYTWIQQIKVEIISRSISSLNGVKIDALVGAARRVKDPTDGEFKDIQVALRNLVGGWGQEVVGAVWKLLMVHCQNIEDRLYESFSDVQQTTDVERRYLERAEREVEARLQEVIKEKVDDLFKDDAEPSTPAATTE